MTSSSLFLNYWGTELDILLWFLANSLPCPSGLSGQSSSKIKFQKHLVHKKFRLSTCEHCVVHCYKMFKLYSFLDRRNGKRSLEKTVSVAGSHRGGGGPVPLSSHSVSFQLQWFLWRNEFQVISMIALQPQMLWNVIRPYVSRWRICFSIFFAPTAFECCWQCDNADNISVAFILQFDLLYIDFTPAHPCSVCGQIMVMHFGMSSLGSTSKCPLPTICIGFIP